MGLFDAYDPATYQDSQSGLLDRLLASVNATPTDPGAGFPSSAMDANAAMPAQQASPIAVGGVQMPRIGPAAAFQLPPGELNPETGEHIIAPAAPAAAPVQQPAALATPAPSPDLGDHLMTAYQNLHHGGGLIGSIVAGFTGQRNDPQAEALQQQQTQLQRQYTALVNAGVPHQQAVLAVLNPEAAKVIIPQALANKQKFVQLKDGLGGDHPAFVDETAQTINGQPIAEYNRQNNANSSAGLGDMSKTGPEYLATLPPQQAGIVKAMVEGRQPPPSSFALSKPYWQNMIAAAQAYDPTFDETKWAGRVAGVKDFSAGKSSEMVRSANQTLQHVNALIDSADALHNGPYPSINWVGNKFNEATGGGEPGAFLLNAHAVADEMGKVFKGANLSDSEIKAWADALSPNMSPAQQRAAIGKMTELLHGALDALDEKRVASIGQVAADKAGPIIKPAGQAVLQRIDGWLKRGNSNAAPAVDRSAVEAEMKRRGLL